MTGLAVCGSVWACPVCSAHIRQERAHEVSEACRRHLEGGGGLAMLTLTVRHHGGQGFAELLDGLMGAWRGTVSGSPWTRARDRYGIVGFVRAVEVTWGEANGWHPHVHVLLFTAAPLGVEALLDLDGWLYDRWRAMVGRRGLGEPTREHGVRLDMVGTGAVGLYVAKVQERSVGLELARGDLKRGRHGDRWLPFDIGDHAGRTGEAWAVRRWQEYEAATHGRRAIEWSRDLRKVLGMDDEREDLEIVEDDGTTAETALVLIPAAEWYAVVRQGREADVLEACEHPDGRDAARDAVVRVVAEAVEADLRAGTGSRSP